ncbi:STAS domain-containing protein [Humitalea sp. 24SJ18S-53]|uniref:STAS domain-containing protein n=1 Tax=Humitalea sp. 24SJ18S-53 TaxID=3422307 RepID=UPI003D66D82D
MQIAESTSGAVTIAAIEGRLDTATAAAAEERLAALVAAGPLVVDLAAVRYVSSAGLRVLLKTAKQAQAAGTRFAVCALQPAVLEVFEISGFDRIIDAFPTQAEAVAAS